MSFAGGCFHQPVRAVLRLETVVLKIVLAIPKAIHRFLNDKEPEESPLPPVIDRIHQGDKKNVLVIMSAGTRLGNTDRLADAYIKGLVERGHSVTKVYLGSMKIEGCRGCGACQRFAHRCAIRDNMQDIYPLFAECDTVVMASPLYLWTITSKLKAFIERLYAISTDDKYPQKDFVLLMTAGDDNDTTFEQPKRYFHLLNQALGWNEVSVYCAGGCTGCEELARQIGKEHLENAYQMGLNL
ncbi:flavodoxin family protein [Bacteroides cellulosilyticus]|uniref:Flavodoxin family protein n=2 Tax=Bacteroides cellulosilyticus TaxID=246787 RepID=A0AAW6M026_9BACE|nr:flavodoxin family protein [Bacteroides cellulosilyticus]MDE8694646.1 flavodoxin family protein [Bacteroides cellulosilyticus]